MATFLQLVNEVEREAGIDVRNQATVDVTAPATARQSKIVGWVQDAWTIIQVARTDWRFMRGEFQHALVTGQVRYTAANLGLSDHAAWAEYIEEGPSPYYVHDASLGQADQSGLQWLPYQRWRERWGRGAPASQRPMEWSVDIENRLCVGPPPDRAWVLSGDYIRTPQTLAANADVPRCPAQFHDAIVYRALMLLGDHDEAPTVIVPSKAKFDARYRALVSATTEQVTW